MGLDRTQVPVPVRPATALLDGPTEERAYHCLFSVTPAKVGPVQPRLRCRVTHAAAPVRSLPCSPCSPCSAHTGLCVAPVLLARRLSRPEGRRAPQGPGLAAVTVSRYPAAYVSGRGGRSVNSGRFVLRRVALPALAGTEPRHRARRFGQRRPTDNASCARPRMGVVSDAREPPPQFDHS